MYTRKHDEMPLEIQIHFTEVEKGIKSIQKSGNPLNSGKLASLKKLLNAIQISPPLEGLKCFVCIALTRI